jgi:hypothetical protein
LSCDKDAIDQYDVNLNENAPEPLGSGARLVLLKLERSARSRSRAPINLQPELHLAFFDAVVSGVNHPTIAALVLEAFLRGLDPVTLFDLKVPSAH